MFAFIFGVSAQTKKIDVNKAVNWTINEKIKFRLGENNQLLPKDADYKEHFNNGEKAVNAEGETVVSGIETPESEVHAIINPTDTNNILVSPIKSDQNSGVSCPIYYTTDFGDTWQTSNFVNMPHESDKTSFGGGDPVFAADKNGRIYFSWIDLYGTYLEALTGPLPMGIFWAYSDDGGATWIQPVHDTILLGHLNVLNNTVTDPISDKQWMAVDQTDGQYANNLYVSYVTIGQRNDSVAFYMIKCKTKPADTLAFTVEANVTDTTGASEFMFVQFSSLDVDNAGNVHVTFYGSRDGYELAVYHSVSTDGGQTFSVPNKISDVKFNLPMFQITPADTIPGVKTDRTYPSPYFAADKNNGNLYMTWTAFGITSDAGQKSQIYFSKSTDNGNTWSTPIVVNDDNANVDNYYSSITVAPNGKVIVSWYDRRGDVANNYNTHYYYAVSNDGGNSFESNLQVSLFPTDFAHVGDVNNGFGIGEYTQVLSTGAYTIPVWTDGRTNDGKLNIYAAFLSPTFTGVGRIQSINENISMSDIYPNPVSDVAKVDVNLKKSSAVSIYVVDEKGVTVKNVANTIVDGKQTINFNVNGLNAGNYYLVLDSEEFGKIVKAFVVK